MNRSQILFQRLGSNISRCGYSSRYAARRFSPSFTSSYLPSTNLCSHKSYIHSENGIHEAQSIRLFSASSNPPEEKNQVDDEAKTSSTIGDTPIETESMDFQAETRQLLDIVTHSLYTDKEIFLRELVSNASDALEKLRHYQSTGQQKDGSDFKMAQADLPLEIKIETDELNNTLTISDTGIGLTKEDMITNLGTIAKSGSKAFVNALQDDQTKSQDPEAAKGIIGKFGTIFLFLDCCIHLFMSINLFCYNVFVINRCGFLLRIYGRR